MSQSDHIAGLSGLAGTKRKFSGQLHHDQPLQFPRSAHILDYPTACAVPTSWSTQAFSNNHFSSQPTHFQQSLPWDQSSSTAWPLISQHPSQHSVPSLTDGSRSAENSPSSYEGHTMSDPRTTPIDSFGRSCEWTTTQRNPTMGSYSYDQREHQHRQQNPLPQQPYSAKSQPAFSPSAYFNSTDPNQQRPLATNFQTWQPFSQHMSVDPSPLDCPGAIPCVDPSCIDGIPCAAPLLPPCDREDCGEDDVIPCAQPHQPVIAESFYSHADPCTPHDAAAGYCCNDECLPETVCPSPCFEEDCQLPPCDLEHPWPTDWTLDNNVCLSAQQHGCVDPRHTFHNHDHLPIQDNSFHQHPHYNCWHGHESNALSTIPEASDQLPESTQRADVTKKKSQELSHLPEKSKHQPRKHQYGASCSQKRKHAQPSTTGACSSSKTNSETDPYICRWVCQGDPEDPNAIICGARHENAENMQLHMNDHVNELERDAETGLFPCLWQGCSHHRGSQGFQARPKLKRHTMTHTGAAPFECDECGRLMRTKDALDKHKRTHSGLKPFVCNEPGCFSRFATSTELKTHLTVHSGKKPHKCPICGDPFADSSNLSKHKKTHERGKFHCPDCPMEMKRWDQMRRHFMSQKHGLYILENKEAERQYKREMDEAFKQLTPEERQLDPTKARERRNSRGRSGKLSRRSSSLSQMMLTDTPPSPY